MCSACMLVCMESVLCCGWMQCIVATEHGRYIETVVCRNCMQYAENVSSAGSGEYVGSFNFML